MSGGNYPGPPPKGTPKLQSFPVRVDWGSLRLFSTACAMTAMTSTDVPHVGNSHQPLLKWWLAAALALAAAVFGFYGLWIYDLAYEERADFWSVAYHTLQLFVLHAPHLEHAVPWQLNLGRWLAAVVVLGAIARGLLMVFQSECRLLWNRCRRGHIVVCGLGRLGMQLAQEFRRDGRRVVAIESSGSAGQIAMAQDAGVAVITGDACSADTLRRAGVGRASKIIAVCGDEQRNVAVAATVGALVGPRRGEESLECWLFITDARLRRTFQQNGLFPHTGRHYRVNVRGLDLFELAARQVLRKVPLDDERIKPDDATIVHLVIVGFGSMGRQLALQAARIGHFANFRKLGVTVVEEAASARTREFRDRHPKISEVCDFTSIDIRPGESTRDAVARALANRSGEKVLTTVAACWDSHDSGRGGESDFFEGLERDDSTNLSLALTLARDHGGHIQVLVSQTRRQGFGALFPVDGRGEAIGPRMHPFGMLEDTCSLEALLHEREDAIAKELHRDYYEKQLEGGKKPGDRPALVPWEQLLEPFKDSNRRAADHIRVKMRAIGYRVDDLRRDQPRITAFDDRQVELLARMEHESWCAEWLLQNYSHGPGERDDVKKTQPYLLPWEKLNPGVQQWDRAQVRAIPEALRRADYGVYPQVR